MTEVIEMTGWDFDTYDDADRDRVSKMLMYKGIKASAEERKSKLRSKRK
jgi:hypothetical protein